MGIGPEAAGALCPSAGGIRYPSPHSTRTNRRSSMTLDQSIVGQVVSEQMEAIERDHGDDPDVEIGSVITIVEVLKREGEEAFASNVRIRTNLGDPYRVLGLIRAAEQNIIQGFNDPSD